jgi:transcriptional regulator with XRE-family HTH domain
MPEPSVLGERLLLSRRRAGLTQQELGKLIGVSSHTIARLEQGRANQIGTRYLERISRVLEVSTDYLLGLSDDPRSAHRGTSPSEPQGEVEEPIGARHE